MRLIVCGAFGRLGAAVCKLAAETDGTQIVAATYNQKKEHTDFPIYREVSRIIEPSDVVISCVPPTAAAEMLAILEYCATRRIPLVLCTTGMPAQVEAAIEKATKSVAVLRSANMSLGINLLSRLLRRISPLLHGTGFDIEIIEKHHNQKIDAPSGTAILLADSINAAMDNRMQYTYNRSDTHVKRNRDEIGIHALRGGTIVGEHTAVFAGRDEVIELTHIATSREVFAVGALKAAQFLQTKTHGLYTMDDVIGDTL